MSETDYCYRLSSDLLNTDSEVQPNFTTQDWMKEILLSFHLLFRDDKRSRTYYRRTARHGAAMTDMDGNRLVDPTLDLLCGFYPSSCDPPMRSHLPYRVAYYPESCVTDCSSYTFTSTAFNQCICARCGETGGTGGSGGRFGRRLSLVS